MLLHFSGLVTLLRWPSFSAAPLHLQETPTLLTNSYAVFPATSTLQFPLETGYAWPVRVEEYALTTP
jgi:hypothetical protein